MAGAMVIWVMKKGCNISGQGKQGANLLQIFTGIHPNGRILGKSHMDGNVGFEKPQLFQLFHALKGAFAQSLKFFKHGKPDPVQANMP